MPEQSPAAHSWELLNAQASSAGDTPLHSPWFIVCLTLKETQHPCTPWLLLSAGNVFHNFLAQGHGTAYRHYFRCVKEMILEGQSVHLSQGRPISHCIIELMFPIWTIWVWSLDWPLCSCKTFVFLLQCALSLSLSLFLPLWTPTFILTLLPSQLSHKMGIIFHSSSCCHNCSSWGLTPPTSLPSLSPKWKFHLNTISACVGSRPEVPMCSLGLAQSPHKARSSPDAVLRQIICTPPRGSNETVCMSAQMEMAFRGVTKLEGSLGLWSQADLDAKPCFTSSMCLMGLG